jgi:hypothetical protein
MTHRPKSGPSTKGPRLLGGLQCAATHPVPCPLGWGSSSADTIKVARLATPSGLFPVFEAEAGVLTSSAKIRRQAPVTDYLRLQARYSHLFRPEERTEVIERLQASADRDIARFGLLANDETSHPERLRLTPDPPSLLSSGGVTPMDKSFAITLDPGSSRVKHGPRLDDRRPLLGVDGQHPVQVP